MKKYKNPKFSIITVCLNAEKSIKKTVQSVAKQTYRNYEYIIVDGASTDCTLESIETYLDENRQIYSEPDKGISNAFNKGVRLARGEFLYFLNSGDYLINESVLQMVAEDLSSEAADIYTYSISNMASLKYPIDKTQGEKLWEDSLIPHQGTFIRKDVFDKVGYFNEYFKVRMDYDFFCRCYLEGMRFFCNPVTIAYYDIQGISSTNSYLFEKEGLAVHLLYKEKVGKEEKKVLNGLLDNIGQEIEEYILQLENQKELTRKNGFNIIALHKWIRILHSGQSVAQYFVEQDIKKVAIYGFGYLGRLLYEELTRNNIEVSYIIDQNKSISDVKITSWDDEWKSVDCIIVTPFYLYNKLCEQIMQKGQFYTISIEEALIKMEMRIDT